MTWLTDKTRYLSNRLAHMEFKFKKREKQLQNLENYVKEKEDKARA